MTKPVINTRWDHVEPVIKFRDESLARQEFLEEANVNSIIKRYQATGVLGNPSLPGRRGVPMFGDFTNVPMIEESYAIITKAQNAFNSLPVAVRRRFNFDPLQMLQFLQDENNRAEAVSLGLLDAPADPDTDPEKKEQKETGAAG